MGKPIEITSKEQEIALFNRFKDNEAKAIDFNIESLGKMEAGLTAILFQKDVSQNDLEQARNIAKQQLYILISKFRRSAEKYRPVFERDKHNHYKQRIEGAIESVQAAIDSIETRLERRKSKPLGTYKDIWVDATQMKAVTDFLMQFVKEGKFIGVHYIDSPHQTQIKIIYEELAAKGCLKSYKGNVSMAKRLFVENFGYSVVDETRHDYELKLSSWTVRDGKKTVEARQTINSDLSVLLNLS